MSTGVPPVPKRRRLDDATAESSGAEDSAVSGPRAALPAADAGGVAASSSISVGSSATSSASSDTAAVGVGMAAMKTVALGGAVVCAVGFGTLACGVAYPDPAARPDATAFSAIISAAAARCSPVSLFVDAADTYCHPHTAKNSLESQLRAACEALPAGASVISSTKSGMVRISSESTGWRPGSTRPEAVRAAILAAQAAMCGSSAGGSSAPPPPPLFLWSLHHADAFAAPGVLEAALAAAKQCVDEGRLLHIGLCNATTPLIARACRVVPILAVQNEWSLFQREAEAPRPPGAAASSRKGVLRCCAEAGIAFVAYAPLGGLKARRGERGMADRGRFPALAALAARRGVSPQAACLAALLHRGRELGATVLLIPGARTAAHAVDSVAAASLELTDAEVRAVMGRPEDL